MSVIYTPKRKKNTAGQATEHVRHRLNPMRDMMGAVTQPSVSLSFCRVHAVAERVVRTRFDSFKPACTLTSASLAPHTSFVKMHAHRLHATSQPAVSR